MLRLDLFALPLRRQPGAGRRRTSGVLSPDAREYSKKVTSSWRSQRAVSCASDDATKESVDDVDDNEGGAFPEEMKVASARLELGEVIHEVIHDVHFLPLVRETTTGAAAGIVQKLVTRRSRGDHDLSDESDSALNELSDPTNNPSMSRSRTLGGGDGPALAEPSRRFAVSRVSRPLQNSGIRIIPKNATLGIALISEAKVRRVTPAPTD